METPDPIPTPGVTQPGAAQPVIEPTYSQQTPAPVQPAPPAAPVPPAPAFQTGGAVKAKWFDGITMMDVVVGSLAVAALTLAILYYRKKVTHIAIEYPELRSDIDDLKKKAEDEEPKIVTEFG